VSPLIESNKIQQQIQVAVLEEQKHLITFKVRELDMKQVQDISKKRASDCITKIGENDDVEAYLHAFETTEKWPKC